MSPVRSNVKIGIATAAAVLALAGGSTVAVAAVAGGFGPGSGLGPPSWRAGSVTGCTVPSLPGTVVDVTLTDMGGRMGSGRRPDGRGRGGTGNGMGGGWSSRSAGPGPMMAGPMSVDVTPTSVPTGTISLRVANNGVRVHELVVLPLADGAQAGRLAVGSDGRVNEDASLGEASATCAAGAGAGEGIRATGSGWTTLSLAPGRYELVCNLPGHYLAGMFAELDVTA